jgi:hypothetical protein
MRKLITAAVAVLGVGVWLMPISAAEAVPIRQEFENAFKELCDEFGPVVGGVVNCPKCGNPVSVAVPTL